MCRKKWLHKMVPYSIECFANATEVVAGYEVYQLPESVEASIKAQLGGWDGPHRPKMIIVGREAYFNVIRSKHFSLMPPFEEDSEMRFELYGLPVLVTPKIEPNGVIVI